MVDGRIFTVQVFKTHITWCGLCVCSLVLWFMNHAGPNEWKPFGKCLDGPQHVNCSQWLDPVRQANHVWAMTSPPCSSPLHSSPLLSLSHLCDSPSSWHSTAACTPREKERQGSRWQKNWDKVQSGAEWIDLKEDKMDGWRREGWPWHLIFIHCRLRLWEPTACV